jgi:catechol 2,3-dioxygenase-like lactoylglutathione lyase family enzyme
LPPRLTGILETVLYCTSKNEAEVRAFYEEILGVEKVGFSFAYRVGKQMLLVFNSDETVDQERPPPHGASGASHACLLVEPGAYEEWKAHLGDAGVAVTDEIDWPNGKRSFYFDDPAGNVLEIADGDIWAR